MIAATCHICQLDFESARAFEAHQLDQHGVYRDRTKRNEAQRVRRARSRSERAGQGDSDPETSHERTAAAEDEPRLSYVLVGATPPARERTGAPQLAIVEAIPARGSRVRNRTRVRANPSLLPVDYINELSWLRDRLLAVCLDLPAGDLYNVVGEIAVLANITDRAEEHVATLRRERERTQAAALRELATMRGLAADRLENDPYVPPPLAAPRHRRLPSRAG